MKDTKLFINGEYKTSNTSLENLNPANGEVLNKVFIPSETDIDDAFEAAQNTFQSSEWSSMSQNDRAELLLAISEQLKENKRDFISAEIADSASVVRKAKADIHNTASFFRVMSKVAKNLNLEQLDERASREGFSNNYRIYEPIGVCAQIIPWNFPLTMAAWKLGPVLATGCTTVLKSALETPVTASMLGEIFNKVGLPKGVVNIVTGGAKEGRYIVGHPSAKKVAFTGSTTVGKEILKSAAATCKVSTMELGGKSANIVLNDADLDIAVDGALYAFLYHSGQACDSGTRLLVQDGIYEKFMTKFKERISQVKLGTPNDPTTGMGPVISEKQFNTIMGYINKTKDEGANLIYGGNRLTDGEFSKGYYIEPTAFEITPDNTIFHEEIFGPVVGITKFKTIEDAIQLANNSIYGLAAGVWSSDKEQSLKLAKKLEAGTVWINEYHLLNPGMPFGGYNQSGIGREMGTEGIHSYLQVKHLWESDCNQRDQKMWFDAIF